MKKIIKILIMLITTFMLILSTIINGSKVEASSWQYVDQLQPVDTSLSAAAAQQGTTDGSGSKEIKKKDPKKIIELEKKPEIPGTRHIGKKQDKLPEPKTEEEIKERREIGRQIR